MTTVSSLVVQRRLATLRQVEEALARQVIYGGDVVTNLMEVAPPPATNEAELTRALADAIGVEPASRASMESPDANAIAKLPRALAEEHGVIPVGFSGESLLVALAEPLSESSVATLREKVGAPVVQVAAPLFRLRQALELAYGLPVDRRTRRLLAKLEGKETLTPPPSTSDLGQAFARGDLEADPMRKDPTLPPPALTPTGKSNRPPPATTIRTSNPGPQALQWFLRSARDTGKPADRASAPNPVVAPPTPAPPPPKTERPSLAKLAQRKRRGPFTRAEAEEALGAAQHADEAFAALFEFAQQYVTYAALFLVKEDLAEGFDAHGPGASGERVRRMGVPLDLPSAFASARDERVPVFRRGERDGLDAVIASDLDRAQRGDLVVLPIVVGKRVVALLYGDDAKERMALEDLAEVLAVGALTGATLSRIILRRKQKSIPQARASERPPPMRSDRPPRTERASMPGVAERARALASALGAQRGTARPPPPSVAPAAPPSVAPPSAAPPVSPPMPAVAQPTIPATPVSLVGLMQRSMTPAPESPHPYSSRSRSDPPAAAVSPAPGARITQRFPAAQPIEPDEPLQPPREPPRPSQGRTTDPYGIPRVEEPKAALTPPAPSREATDAAVRSASVAKIELKTIAEEVVSSRGVTDVAPPTPPKIEDPAPEPQDDHEPMPLMSSMPMPPPPAFAARRALGPTLPRDDEGRAAEPTPPLTPTIEPIPLDTPAFATSEPAMIVADEEVSDDELEEFLELAQPPMREGERLEAYPPRPPPRPMPLDRVSGSLPKVIVAVDPESIALVEQLLRGGENGEKAAESLRESGLASLPALMERFPGPTRVDRMTPLSRLPRPADAGPVLGMLAKLGRLALLDVIARTGDPSADARFWATYLLTEIVDPESGSALVPRLVDDDVAVRRVAGLAAHVLIERIPGAATTVVDPLVGVLLDPGAPAVLRVRSAHALGDVRDGRAVEGLILGLESYDEELGRACHEALVAVTRHDPTATGGSWPSWFSKHKGEHRIEWLIDALLDEPEPIRDAAGGELKSLTKQYFGYYANLARLEREAAQRRYRAWWQTEGKAKFAPGE